MKNVFAFLATALVAAATGCGSSGGSGPLTIDPAPLDGSAYGNAWTFTAGTTQSLDQDGYFTSLYPVAWTCSDFGDPSGNAPFLLTTLPAAVGTYDLGFNGKPTLTFVQPPSTNDIATNGTIRIDSVSATEITGGLVARIDDANYVSGTFTISICPSGF
jgi:hypothetical protein